MWLLCWLRTYVSLRRRFVREQAVIKECGHAELHIVKDVFADASCGHEAAVPRAGAVVSRINILALAVNSSKHALAKLI